MDCVTSVINLWSWTIGRIYQCLLMDSRIFTCWIETCVLTWFLLAVKASTQSFLFCQVKVNPFVLSLSKDEWIYVRLNDLQRGFQLKKSQQNKVTNPKRFTFGRRKWLKHGFASLPGQPRKGAPTKLTNDHRQLPRQWAETEPLSSLWIMPLSTRPKN